MVNDATQRAIRQRLESLLRAGVAEVARSRTATEALGEPRVADSRLAVAGTSSPEVVTRSDVVDAPQTPLSRPERKRTSMTPAEKQTALEEIAREVAMCTFCPALCETRTQTVFGVGNPDARLVFFGEAPGADEDQQGEPFVGRAGQLLTKIIEAMTLRREDVYILNTLKCRPPHNRNPLPDEVANCRPFFDRQLTIIQPEFICCLGAISAKNLLESKQSIGQLRGKFHDWNGTQVIATYHPAYLLRNPPAKKDVWQDMQMLMKAMGISPS